MNKTPMTLLRSTVMLAALSATHIGVAGTAEVSGATVTRLVTDSSLYGGCIAYLVPGPESTSLSCSANWVTFSCTGDFNTKAQGNTKFAAAQLAYVTGNNFRVFLDDSKKHNGICWARIADNQ